MANCSFLVLHSGMQPEQSLAIEKQLPQAKAF
jgi:hypothetical protein